MRLFQGPQFTQEFIVAIDQLLVTAKAALQILVLAGLSV